MNQYTSSWLLLIWPFWNAKRIPPFRQEKRRKDGTRSVLSGLVAAPFGLLVADKAAVLQLAHGLLQLSLRIHHDRPVPRHRLFERFAGNQQKPDALRAGLDHDLVAAVKQHQRVVSRVVH